MSALKLGIFEVGALQLSGLQVSALQLSGFEVGVLQLSCAEIGPLQLGISQGGMPEVGLPEIGPLELALGEVGVLESRAPQVETVQDAAGELRLPILHPERRCGSQDDDRCQGVAEGTAGFPPLRVHSPPVLQFPFVSAKGCLRQRVGMVAPPDRHQDEEELQKGQQPIRGERKPPERLRQPWFRQPLQPAQVLPPEKNQRERNRAPGGAVGEPELQV